MRNLGDVLSKLLSCHELERLTRGLSAADGGMSPEEKLDDIKNKLVKDHEFKRLTAEEH